MPVRNGERFVGDAIESICAQTMDGWEFVIVDDGSSDGTARILSDHAGREGRIKVLSLPHSKGLREALNVGLAVATGDWVARQDADDLSAANRLTRQLAEARRGDAVVLGSDYDVVELSGGASRRQCMPASDTAIRWRLFFDNAFAHTSIVFRRTLRDGTPVRYESQYCEDYDLWTRLLRHGKGENLPEPLVTRREHGETYTIREEANQTAERNSIALREIARVAPGVGFSLEDATRLHGWYFFLPSILGPEDLTLCRKVCGLLRVFGRQPMVDCEEARKIAGDWYARILVAIPDYRYRLSWRMGLMGRLFVADPWLVINDLRRRVGARRGMPAKGGSASGGKREA